MTKKELAQYRKRKARIMSMLADGLSQAEIARKLDMKRQRIHQIVRGR